MPNLSWLSEIPSKLFIASKVWENYQSLLYDRDLSEYQSEYAVLMPEDCRGSGRE